MITKSYSNASSNSTGKSEKIIFLSGLLILLTSLIIITGFLKSLSLVTATINSVAGSILFLVICTLPLGLTLYAFTIKKSKTLNDQPAIASSSALTSTRILLGAVLDSAPIGFLVVDNDYTILEFNGLMEDFAKIAWLQPLQKNDNLLGFLPIGKVQDFTDRYRVVLQGKKMNYEVAYVWDDGSTTNFDMNLNPIFNGDGSVTGCCISSEDISVRLASGNKISAMNAALEKKVAERTLQYEAVNKELEAFSFSVSHDLRAPLRAVNSYAQIMLEDYGKNLDEGAHEVLEKIRYNGEKMGRLIDELLSFSRLGRKEIERVTVNMDELVKRVIADLNDLSSTHASLKLAPLPIVQADYTMLYQVMYNLISNAIKYSSKKETPVIEVFTEQQNDKTVFIVKDNGAGFDMRFSDKLFGVFQRLHSEKQFEGNGVGLAIVQRIITKFGGHIWGEGKENEGATFYFTFN